MAALAGVAQSTVSYVLTGKRSVAPETRARIEDAIRELSYRPNAGARALRGSRANVVALFVRLSGSDDLAESAPYIETVIDEARTHDWHVVLSTNARADELEELAGRRIADAFVLMDVGTHDRRIASAAAVGAPTVLFGRPADRFGLDAVDFDTRRAAELLVDELADTGHRRAVMIGESPSVDTENLRFLQDFRQGARDRAAERGLEFTIVDRSSDGFIGLANVMDQALNRREHRLGLIARTPQVTEWLVQLLMIHRMRVGVDISLVSMCTDDLAARFDPAVSNVSPRPRDLSRAAMDILFSRIDGDHARGEMRLIAPTAVVRRGTTADFSDMA